MMTSPAIGCDGASVDSAGDQRLNQRIGFALAAAARIGVWDWDLNSAAATWPSSVTGLGLNAEEASATGTEC
jgi:hypothetical protein